MKFRASMVIAPFVLALASPAEAEPVDEATALTQQIQQISDALNTANCPLACQALASMQRATERLCAIDPGPRCAEAKTKVKAAEDKVRAACPDCAAAQLKPEAPADAGVHRGPRKGVGKKGDIDQKPEEPAPPRGDAAKPAAPPPSSESVVVKGGGCAGCEVGAADERGLWGASLLMGLWAVSRWRRRRGNR